ncbi:MAG: hypothetical protein ACREMY_26030, partial [bacterium]
GPRSAPDPVMAIVGDGRPEERAEQEALVAEVELAIQAAANGRIAQLHASKAQAQGISTTAYTMRERRKNPVIKEQEHQAQRAKNLALGQLARNHPEEFLALEQLERRNRGLPPLQPRKRRAAATEGRAQEQEAVHTLNSPVLPAPTGSAAANLQSKAQRKEPKPPVRVIRAPKVVLVPPEKAIQDKCRHNMGLTKLSYGTFCVECGHRVR